VLEWVEDEMTEIFVVDLRTGKVGRIVSMLSNSDQVREYQTEPTYSAHHANAYEDGDEVLPIPAPPSS
jgi:carotenoid cleavage dioxygenase-like enzyme